MTRLGDALYRLVLVAFPRDFRQHHAAAMQAQFRAQRQARRWQPIALASLWARAISDALWHGLSIRRERRLDGARVSRLPGERFRQDLRFAWRGLVRDRAVTAVVVLTLTLGIAANAVMFGLVDRLLFRAPAGVGHPETVRRVYFGSERSPGVVSERESYPAVAAIRDRVSSFAGAASTFRQQVTIGGGPDARQAMVELANADYFSVLELRPSAGRFFTREEDRLPDAAGVVVLSHAFWTRQFGADPRAIGRDVRVDGKPLTIVGVAPRRFSGLDPEPVDLWAPPGALGRELLGARWHENFFRYGFGLVVRLAPASTDALATDQAIAAHRATKPEGAPRIDELRTAFTARLAGLHDPYGIAPEGKVSAWLLGVAVVVLLIAIANVANVLLTRTFTRRREIAVRLAIGISRGRLLRQLLTESALLTTLAVGVALAVAYLGGRAIQQVFVPGLAVDATAIDLRALAVTLVLAAVTSFGVGLAPAWYALTSDLSDSLRASSRSTARRGGRLRTALLITQVALSVVLLVGAGLFVRSLLAVRANDVGIDLDRVILARLSDRASVPLAEAESLHALAVERLTGMPGVASVAVTRGSSPMGFGTASTVLHEGETLSDLKGRPMPGLNVISADYFPTVGASLLRGRGLTDEDVKTAARVAVVNRAMADEWRGADPLGRCIYFGAGDHDCTRIVGIVENVLAYNRVETNRPQLYLTPSHPNGEGKRPRGLLVRAKGDARDLVPAIRQALQTLAPDMPFVPADTLETLVAPQLKPWRLGTTMFLIFGGIALVIAVVGLYSAMAFAVSQRTMEIAIRIALGASRRHVARQVGAHGLASIGAGLVVGLALAAVATRWLVDLLYETSPRDPLVFAVVIGVLSIAAMAAAAVPIRRSTAVDPIAILKAE